MTYGGYSQRIEGEGGVTLAMLLEAGFAAFALAAGIDQAADGGQIAFLEFADLRPNLANAADDFMTGNSRIGGWHKAGPLVAHGVQVGMAHAAVQNLDLNIRRAGLAPLE